MPALSGNQIWALTRSTQTVEAVNTALAPFPSLRPMGVCGSWSELIASLDQHPTPVTLIDIDPQPSQMLTDLEQVIARFDQTRFVVLCTRFSNELLMQAMQVGVRQFVTKEAIGTDLPAALQKLTAATTTRARPRGAAVTILSASGGCGATLLAVNLANELAIAGGSASLVVDLDVAYGAVAEYLGLDGRYGIADLLGQSQKIDAALAASTALPHSESLHALLSPASVNFDDPVLPDYRQLPQVMEAVRQAYRWTVIDAPRVAVPVATQLAMASKATFIVSQLCVKDIRLARSLALAMERRGVPPQSIRHVINRYARRAPLIQLDEAAKALGGVKLELISNDFRAASESLNFGKPLAQSSPKSALRRDVMALAATLGETASQTTSFAAAF